VDSLWQSPPHPPHLVHGDLTPQNVIVSPHPGLVPIDFQDTVRSFEVQDLSITVSALRRWPDSDRLVNAFRSGYCECRAWPDASRGSPAALELRRGLSRPLPAPRSLPPAGHGCPVPGDARPGARQLMLDSK
jgi:hypothetical protein